MSTANPLHTYLDTHLCRIWFPIRLDGTTERFGELSDIRTCALTMDACWSSSYGTTSPTPICLVCSDAGRFAVHSSTERSDLQVAIATGSVAQASASRAQITIVDARRVHRIGV